METVMMLIGIAPQIIAIVAAGWAVYEKIRGKQAVAATAEAYKMIDTLIVAVETMPESDLKEKAKQHIEMLNRIAGTEAQVNGAVKAIEALLKANGLWQENEEDAAMTRRAASLVAEIKRKGATRL